MLDLEVQGCNWRVATRPQSGRDNTEGIPAAFFMFRMNGTSRQSTWMCDAKPLKYEQNKCKMGSEPFYAFTRKRGSDPILLSPFCLFTEKPGIVSDCNPYFDIMQSMVYALCAPDFLFSEHTLRHRSSGRSLYSCEIFRWLHINAGICHENNL